MRHTFSEMELCALWRRVFVGHDFELLRKYGRTAEKLGDGYVNDSKKDARTDWLTTPTSVSICFSAI